MNALGDAIGKICQIVLPIHEESFLGNQNSTLAVCTLSSMSLLRYLAHSDLMHHVSIIGRLLSENKGIDSMLSHLNDNRHITSLLICGTDVMGHRAGHSLLKLYQNGIVHDNGNNRIVDSASPDPYVTIPKHMIDHFQNDITIIDMIGQTDPRLIFKWVIDNHHRY